MTTAEPDGVGGSLCRSPTAVPVVEVGNLSIGKAHLLSQVALLLPGGCPRDAILRDGEMNNGNKCWQLVRYQMIMTSFFFGAKS